MRYQRSLEIEQRLQAVLTLIQSGRYSTPGLAEELGVSIPTISRCVEVLRERGHDIVGVVIAGGGMWIAGQKKIWMKARMMAEVLRLWRLSVAHLPGKRYRVVLR